MDHAARAIKYNETITIAALSIPINFFILIWTACVMYGHDLA